MTDDLWIVPPAADVRTPYSIMLEQSAKLQQHTRGLLMARVSRDVGFNNTIEVTLYIVVPALNNYIYVVAKVYYPVGTVYPCTVVADFIDLNVEAGNEVEFVEILGKILRSKTLVAVLASLIAQAAEGT